MTFANVAFGFTSQDQSPRKAQALRVFRLFRLVRVARTTRLLHSVPELLILARGMLAGMRSVVAVFSLLLLIVYVFAITFTMMLSGTKFEHGVFETVPESMNTLLLQVLCGADAQFIKELLDVSIAYYLLYLAFLLVGNLTLMNMLIGILCDVVSNVAADSKEEVLMKEVKKQVARLAATLDMDSDGGIDKQEFENIVKDPELTATFIDLGVDVVGLVNFATFVYEQTDQLSYPDFELLTCQFRGKKIAEVQDIMDMRRYVTMELLSLESRLRTNIESINSESLAVSQPTD